VKNRIAGLIAAPFTPFDADGNLAPDLVPQYAALLARQGVAGVFVAGTTVSVGGTSVSSTGSSVGTSVLVGSSVSVGGGVTLGSGSDVSVGTGVTGVTEGINV